MEVSSNRDIHITPLDYDTLQDALRLQNSVFPDLEENESLTLHASLDKKTFQGCYESLGIDSMRYYVAQIGHGGKVVGLTGFYSETDDVENSVWLGWFCIDEAYRGSGHGEKMLRCTIARAKGMGKHVLHLYTHNSKAYEAAIGLYEKLGFEAYGTKRSKHDYTLYFKKVID